MRLKVGQYAEIEVRVNGQATMQRVKVVAINGKHCRIKIGAREVSCFVSQLRGIA